MKIPMGILLSLAMIGLAGCRSSGPDPRRAVQHPVQPPFAAPPVPVPMNQGPSVVAPPVQIPPPPAPVHSPPQTGPVVPPPVSMVPTETRHFQQPPQWQPLESTPKTTQEPPRVSILLLPPEPLADAKDTARLPSDQPKQATRLYPPEANDPVVTRRPPPALPVGIPQFGQARENVASGLRPSLDEGLDWLQTNGYRTVLMVRAPGEQDQADRKQVEKRGMKFLSIEVSPQNLSREIVEMFNKLVSDKSSFPLFVYDRDGSLAGGLWYLHFRTSEQLPDDAARIRAGSLGLREDRDDNHRQMWLAIQAYLGRR